LYNILKRKEPPYNAGAFCDVVFVVPPPKKFDVWGRKEGLLKNRFVIFGSFQFSKF
jgi:hypothetical protein